jgi:hypothetical protein
VIEARRGFFAEDHNRAMVADLNGQLQVQDAEKPKTGHAVAGKTGRLHRRPGSA